MKARSPSRTSAQSSRGLDGGRGQGRQVRCPPDGGPGVPTGLTLVWAPNPPLPECARRPPVLRSLVEDPGDHRLDHRGDRCRSLRRHSGAGKASFSVGGTFDETDPSALLHSQGSYGKPSSPSPASPPQSPQCAAAVALFRRRRSVLARPGGDSARCRRADHRREGGCEIGLCPTPQTRANPTPADVKWTYTRFTTGKTYEHSVSETQTNVHVSDAVEVETPATVHPFKPLWVHAKFRSLGGHLFKGAAVTPSPSSRHPAGLLRRDSVADDGLGFDPVPPTMAFTPEPDPRGRAYRCSWNIR